MSLRRLDGRIFVNKKSTVIQQWAGRQGFMRPPP